MNKFWKKETDTDNKTVKNAFRLKYGGFSTAMIILVLVAVIALNLLMGVLNERGVLKFDATKEGKYTITEANEEFIKKIDREVTVTVLSNKLEYSSLNNFAGQYYNVVDENNYFEQTLTLLERYNELNKKITIKYVDYYGDTAKKIAEKHPSIFYGDIIVSFTDDAGTEHDRLIGFSDIYSYSDPSGYASYGYSSYIVDGNKLETALSSAINILLYGDQKNLALISSHSTSAVFEQYYKNTLSLNGFNVSEITETVLGNIPADTDTVVLAAPMSDLLPEEVAVLNKWLLNDGNRGKSLIFIPGASVSNFPNLCEFLEEWGIKYSAGTVYETDKEYYYTTPTTIFTFPENNDVTKEIIENLEGFCVVGNGLPMEKAFESYESREPTVIVSTNDMATIKPENSADDWKPAANAVKKSYPSLIITKDEDYIDNVKKTSYVAAFSSFDFVYSQWAQYSQLLNLDTALGTAMYISGMDTSSTMTFVPKTITDENFADKLNENSSIAINIIFMIVIPVAIIVCGIVIFFRRKSKR